MPDDILHRVQPSTIDALREAFAGASEVEKPGVLRLSLADRAAGKGLEIAAKALKTGAAVLVERTESAAQKGIREYAEANPRAAVIKREQEAARELARRVRR